MVDLGLHGFQTTERRILASVWFEISPDVNSDYAANEPGKDVSKATASSNEAL